VIDSTFVKEVERLALENEVEIISDEGGREYFTGKTFANEPPRPAAMELSTLDGLVDMIVAEELSCSVYIAGPREVGLLGALDKLWRKREMYAVSRVGKCGFPFEREMSIEDFIINVQCNFAETPEKKRVIDLVSAITASEVTTAEDDGIAQEIVTKATIGHKKSKVKLDPIVELRPFRTFREIDQPADKFLIRMHQRGEGRLPDVSLRSAGGDMWKNEAIQAIYAYLMERVPEGVAVIR